MRTKLLRFLDSRPGKQASTGASATICGISEVPGDPGHNIGSWYVPIKRVLIAAAPNPATHTVALTWANGETTVNSVRTILPARAF
jgi:hypothetical protein